MPDSKSSTIEKKPSFNNVTKSTLSNSDKTSSNKRLIAKKMKSTFKTQIIDRRQFQGITIINNFNNDLFIFCARIRLYINSRFKAIFNSIKVFYKLFHVFFDLFCFFFTNYHSSNKLSYLLHPLLLSSHILSLHKCRVLSHNQR